MRAPIHLGIAILAAGALPAQTLIREMVAGPEGLSRELAALTPAGNELAALLRAPDGVYHWRSDGTELGTLPYAKIGPSYYQPSEVRAVTVGNMTYLSVTGLSTPELWVSGKEFAPIRIREVFAHAARYGRPLAGVGDILFYEGETTGAGLELWRTDGTAAGTRLVKNIEPGYKSSRFDGATCIDGLLYFFGGGETSYGLWRSDGTADGTVCLAPGLRSYHANGWESVTFANLARQFVGNQDSVYFLAAGNTLWRTDGTPQGTTQLLASVGPEIAAFKGKLYFAGTTSTFGTQLYSGTGTVGGTDWMLLQAGPPASSSPAEFVELAGRLYFAASTDAHGRELWSTDGTAAGTSLVADIEAGTTGSDPSGLTVWNNRVYFAVNTPGIGTTLWSSDGTAAGTLPVSQEVPGVGTNPRHITPVGGRLFFLADTVAEGTELHALTCNMPPMLQAAGPVATHPPGVNLVRLAFRATVTDMDSHDFDGGRLALRWGAGRKPSDRLRIGPATGISVAGETVIFQPGGPGSAVAVGSVPAQGPGSGRERHDLVITLLPGATAACVQALIRALELEGGEPLGESRRVLFIELSDGDGGAAVPVMVRTGTTRTAETTGGCVASTRSGYLAIIIAAWIARRRGAKGSRK